MNQTDSETQDLARSSTRRRVLQTAAWSVPVLATTIAAPLASASPDCPSVSNPANWTTLVDGPLRSGLQPQWQNQYGGTEIPLSVDNASSFLSIQDRIGPVGSGQTNIVLETSFVPVAGNTYTFTFRARTNNNLPGVQRLAVLIGATTVWTGATKPGFVYPVMSSAETTYSFTWTASNSDPTRLRYVFQVYADPDNVDDIRVRLPIITSPSCG